MSVTYGRCQLARHMHQHFPQATATTTAKATLFYTSAAPNPFSHLTCPQNHPRSQLRQQCSQALVAAGCPLVGDAFGATVAENAVRLEAASCKPLKLLLTLLLITRSYNQEFRYGTGGDVCCPGCQASDVTARRLKNWHEGGGVSQTRVWWSMAVGRVGWRRGRTGRSGGSSRRARRACRVSDA